MANGKERAQANVKAFKDWAQRREVEGDWGRFVRRGRLNRTLIARECQFGSSVFGQNPKVRSALADLEANLRQAGVLPSIKGKKTRQGAFDEEPEASMDALEQRVATSASRDAQRIKALEERCAAQLVEIAQLRERLRQYEHMEEHLARTGRMLPK